MKGHAMHHMSKQNFHLDFSFAPSTVTAGKPIKLVFKPMDAASHKTVILETVHEKDMHLLIVSDDLSYFSHEHPHQVADQYVHVHHFPRGGNFILFVDYSPQGSGQHVSRHELKVEGNPAERRPLSDQQTAWREHGYRLFISEDQLPLQANTMLELTLHVEKEGKPVQDLDSYLGALAHVVIIGEDTKEYLHVHPLESLEKCPEIKLHTSFPHAGKYKMFVQFQHQGQVHTAFLILDIMV